MGQDLKIERSVGWKVLELISYLIPVGCTPPQPPTHSCTDNNGDGVPGCYPDAGVATIEDRDGDGIPDSNDQCPDQYAETATGCSQVSVDGGESAPDGGALLVPSLKLERTIDLQTASTPSCAHLALGSETCGVTAWQEGSSFVMTSFNPTNGMTEAPKATTQNLNTSDLTLCNVKKSVAVTGDCKTVGLLWPELVQGNLVKLMFQTVDRASGTSSTPVALDSFPLPALGPGGLNVIAALGVFPNNEFVAVWTDRDRVEASFISAAGMVLQGPLTINDELDVIDPLTLNVINPDLSVTGIDTLVVGWQEGNGQNGRVTKREVQRVNGVIAGGGFDPIKNRMGRWPGIGGKSTLISIGQDDVGHGEIPVMRQPNIGTFTFGPPAGANPNGYTLFVPEVVLDASSRLTLAWPLQDPAGPTYVHIAGIGDLNMAGLGEHYSGDRIGITSPKDRVGLSASGNLVAAGFVLYGQGMRLNKIAVSIFRWSQ